MSWHEPHLDSPQQSIADTIRWRARISDTEHSSHGRAHSAGPRSALLQTQPSRPSRVSRVLTASFRCFTHSYALFSFDEVHFGKFASYYLLREYYFDVHPPLAKMLNAAAGWFVGFDGRFEFETIGDSYSAAHVPYVGIRALPATLGALTIPVVYETMRECGFPIVIAALSASLVCFGTPTQSFHLDSKVLKNACQIMLTSPKVVLSSSTLLSFSSSLYPCTPTFVSASSGTGSSLMNGGAGCAPPVSSWLAVSDARWSVFLHLLPLVLLSASTCGTYLTSGEDTAWSVAFFPRFFSSQRSLNLPTGPHRASLLCSRHRSHRPSVHVLSLLLLGPLQDLEALWYRRPLHEPCFPRELGRK